MGFIMNNIYRLSHTLKMISYESLPYVEILFFWSYKKCLFIEDNYDILGLVTRFKHYTLNISITLDLHRLFQSLLK